MKYQHYILKRKVEAIFIFPFIVLGTIIAKLSPLKKEYDVFFFFPFYHTGGAEKVHALIVQAAGNKNAIVYFTRKSADNTFKSEFEKVGCTIKNISTFTDNKWLYFFNLIYRGIIQHYINHQQKRPVVFNGQCNFGYKISPWIKPSIKQIELIHSFNTFSWIRLPYLPFISSTIMISKVRIENHISQYEKLQVPPSFNQKIKYICNGINLPKTLSPKDFKMPLKILYVGRGTSEKRVHLVAKIAADIQQTFTDITITIAGDVDGAIPESFKKYCILKGNIDDEKQLAELYQQSHILLITSNTEGFPMVVMEAMSYGCAIIATPVGDLPVHVKNGINGFITSIVNEEELVIQEMANQIKLLNNDRLLLQTISNQNIHYAKEHFDIEIFKKNYVAILHQP